MTKPRLVLAFAALFLCSSISATALQFGEPFPLTNARYQETYATTSLASNNRQVFVLWWDFRTARFNKLAAVDTVLGRPVVSGRWPLAIWTGDHFLLAAENKMAIVDGEGMPVGPEFDGIPRGSASAMATNGRNVMILASDQDNVFAYVFDTNGILADPVGHLLHTSSSLSLGSIASNGSGYVSIQSVGPSLRITTFDENGVTRAEQTIAARTSKQPLIASDGRDYLAIWTDPEGRLQSIHIQQNGTMSAPLILAAPAAGATRIHADSLIRLGNRYAVALTTLNDSAIMRTVVAFIRPTGIEAQTVTLVESPSPVWPGPSLIAANGSVFASWRTAEGTHVRDLSGSTPDTVFTFWSANEQEAISAIAASDSTLVVWNEDQRRIGIRRQNGSWTERALSPASIVKIGTDGHGFLIADLNARTATYYEPSGNVRWNARTAFSVDAILWDGDRFLIAGSASKALLLARWSDSGELSPAERIAINTLVDPFSTRFATDGTNVLVAYAEGLLCPLPCGYPPRPLRGLLLNSNLQPLGSEFRIDAEVALSHPVLTFDGTQYIVIYIVWRSDESVIVAKRISRDGVVDSRTIEIARGDTSFAIAPTTYGTVIASSTWRDDVSDVRLLTRGGNVLPLGTFAGTTPVVAAHPDGRLEILTSHAPPGEPYFGSNRLMMTIGDVLPPAALADAPKVAVALDVDQRLVVTWKAPAQPVNGYRVEYKIGQQEWMELERWFGPNDTSLTVTPAGNPTTYSFRIRAWSDSGTSAYSASAALRPGKRRSVR